MDMYDRLLNPQYRRIKSSTRYILDKNEATITYDISNDKILNIKNRNHEIVGKIYFGFEVATENAEKELPHFIVDEYDNIACWPFEDLDLDAPATEERFLKRIEDLIK